MGRSAHVSVWQGERRAPGEIVSRVYGLLSATQGHFRARARLIVRLGAIAGIREGRAHPQRVASTYAVTALNIRRFQTW